MNSEEFRAASRLAKKEASWVTIAIFIVWLAFFIGILLPRCEPAPPFLLGLMAMTVAANLLFVPIWFVLRTVARRHDLACPNCGQWFTGMYANDVLKTGRCPKCKSEIFSD